MKARLIFDRRVAMSETAFVEIVLWELPKPAAGVLASFQNIVSRWLRGEHAFFGTTMRRERAITSISAGKNGPYRFIDPDRLLADFFDSVKRWNDENPHS